MQIWPAIGIDIPLAQAYLACLGLTHTPDSDAQLDWALAFCNEVLSAGLPIHLQVTKLQSLEPVLTRSWIGSLLPYFDPQSAGQP